MNTRGSSLYAHILKTIVEWHVIWLQGKIKTYIKTELCEKLGTIADQVFASTVFLDHVYLRQTTLILQIQNTSF